MGDTSRQQPQEGRETARQKVRFEEWANRKRAELQTTHHDQAGRLGQWHGTQSQAQDQNLAATYGPGRDEASRKLAEAEARRDRGEAFYRLSGRADRDRWEAEAARRTLENIAMREGEQKSALEAQQERERQRQAERQKRERRALEERITQARENRERESWRDLGYDKRQAGLDRANDNSVSQGRERSRDFGWER